MDPAQIELPKYQCHKIVHALKIAAMEIREDKSAVIMPADEGYGKLITEAGWGDKYRDNTFKDTGYYVVYDDGYTSWSPTKAFEEGYTRI